MSKKNLICWLLIFISFMLFSAAGCGGKETTAPGAKENIKVGFSISLTGIYAPAAESQMRAYDLWLEQVNERGGIYLEEYGKKLPVKFVYYDDQSSTDMATRIYEKLVTEDKVDMLLPPWGTTLHFAIAPLTEKFQMPVVGNTACSIKIRELDAKYFWFITSCIPDRQTEALVDLMKEHKNQLKTVAITYVQDLFPRENLEFLEPYLKAAGFEVVLVKDYPIGVSDLSSLMAEIKRLNPDAYLALSYPEDSFLITNQAIEAGLNPKLFLLLVGPSIAAYDAGYGAATEGILTQGHWSPKRGWAGAQEFYDGFVKKYGERPDYLDSVLAYVSCEILEQSLTMAGSLDKEAVRDVIATSVFETINGPIEFTGVENMRMPAMWLQWQQGELEIVWPAETATAKLLIPKPKW
ncbi:MAG: amino acid ABC transporter substrate-binding protein [Bacillota bacterium]|nr:amino acid ABC transporter substrate-binding protein [Bacillota bacterium]